MIFRIHRLRHPAGHRLRLGGCDAERPDDEVGLLFERDGYSKISFTHFKLDELENGPPVATDHSGG